MNSKEKSHLHEELSAPSPTSQIYRDKLTGRARLIHELDRPAYLDCVAAVFDQYQPATPMEQFVVQQIADTAWNLQRFPFYESGIFALARHKGETWHTYSKTLASLSLRQTRSLRHLGYLRAELRKLQSEREILNGAQSCKKTQRRPT